jgi:O-antigen/teichoic acid export membrane protein
VVGIFSTIWLYLHFDWLVPDFRDIQWDRTRELLNTGLPFFATQVAGFVLLQTDNLIIAQVLGAEAVTPYSVTAKLFSYALLLPVIALPSLWPAYSDAFARHDFTWIRKTYRYNVLVVISTTTIFVLVLFIIAKRFISIWAGPAAVPTSGLITGMGIWTIIASLCWCQTCLLGAAGQVRRQAIYSAIGAIVNVIASIICGRLFGLTGIIMGTLLAYLVCIVVPQTLEVRKVLMEKYT